MKVSQNNAREVAWQILQQVRQQHAYSNLQLNQSLQKADLNVADQRLVTALVYGVLQHQLTLEYWLAPFIKGKKVTSWVQTLFLMTIYQYHYLDRIPDWAATNEAIEIAKHHGNPGIRKFVTGVCHVILRQGVVDFTTIKDPIQRLSISASLPQWLIEKLNDQYGIQVTEAIAESVNQPANQSLRVNTALTTLEAVQTELESTGFEVTPSPLVANALILKSGNVTETAAFNDGRITIQDESAMLAVESMQVQPDDVVLDACAAPGGKTVQIAENLTTGKVVALDIHAHKIKLIEKSAHRMQVADRVQAIQLDARKVNDRFADETFDKILVDAPCSGFGLLRRKPEIRYDKTWQDSQNLHQIQGAILDSVAPKVKKGGIITYSTCTILSAENDGTVQAFLARHPEFELMTTHTARAIKNDRHAKTLTILLNEFNSDGFFISNLKRVR